MQLVDKNEETYDHFRPSHHRQDSSLFPWLLAGNRSDGPLDDYRARILARSSHRSLDLHQDTAVVGGVTRDVALGVERVLATCTH